ncbi:cation transporter [Sphingomonas sp. HMP6]|nr:cation transporter [Sphingomonas sp. HMP6]
MRVLGVNANIMSLGGIAIAMGPVVDAAVVMIENAHKHLERWAHDLPGETLSGEARWRVITTAASEVGPAVFLSLLIMTFSFMPLFNLQGHEGRLVAPLAFTKTYTMAGAALLSVTLVPMLMGWLIRGRIPAESSNPMNRWLTAIYRPAFDWVMLRPRATLVIAAFVFATTAPPLGQLGG